MVNIYMIETCVRYKVIYQFLCSYFLISSKFSHASFLGSETLNLFFAITDFSTMVCCANNIVVISAQSSSTCRALLIYLNKHPVLF